MSETTIGVSRTTKERLLNLKRVPEEYYDSVITRLICTSSLTGGTI